jgi:hypothetical protein
MGLLDRGSLSRFCVPETMDVTGYQRNQTGYARPLDQIETEDEGLGFDEVDDETPEEVGGEKETEGRALGMSALVVAVEEESKRDEEDHFVELGGVAGDAVAEVDAPGERGGCSVGVVGEASEKAAYTADGDADAEWDGEEVSRAGVDSANALGDFNRDPSAEESADDGFASGLEEGSPGDGEARGLLEDAEDSGAKERADGSSRDDDPTLLVGEEVSGSPAGAAVELIAGGVGEDFEESVKCGMGGKGQDLER